MPGNTLTSTIARQRPATGLALRIVAQYEHVLLGAMLLLLHIASSMDLADGVARSLMIAHLGLFVLWQPIWRGDQRLDLLGGMVFAVFTIGFIALLNGWLLACWLILIIGLIGGRTLNRPSERTVYMLSLLFLISKLLIVVIPLLFPARALPVAITSFFRVGLSALPVFIALVPSSAGTTTSNYAVDLFRGMIAALMAALVALGSVVTMYRTNAGYVDALIYTCLLLGGLLFALSWLLRPGTASGGLGELWERSLLNIGTPFEDWLINIADIAEEQRTPEHFLSAAMNALVRLPWVRGVEWEAPDSQGLTGQRTMHSLDLNAGGIHMQLYVQRDPGATLRLHGRLLLQLLVNFYTAKQREQELARQAHVQAIHETGARLTHDIKNLLQSLQTMTSVIGDTGDLGSRGNHRARHFLEQQLPLITQRLQLALDKLQSPTRQSSEEVALQTWWDQLKARHHGTGIEFIARITSEPMIPGDLFDSVVENLLENARQKRQLQPEIEISVTLESSESVVRVEVSDSGTRMPQAIVDGLFKRPLTSQNGLGIGLYQAAQQAEIHGYRLSIHDNIDGHVCLALTRIDNVSPEQ